MRRVGVFGWGIVAPRSPNVEAFAANLTSAESWLTPFNGFGPDNFLVGTPEFSFADYKGWIAERFPPNRFSQLTEKMDLPTLYAVGAFIQSLGQNPGIEAELTRLGSRAHVYIGTGLGSVATIADGALALERAQRRWDRFWGERNPARPASAAAGPGVPGAPPAPETMPAEERADAEDAWWRYWAAGSPDLHTYLREVAEVESLSIQGDVATGKISVLKERQRGHTQLQKRWGCPEPPWRSVSANLVWNIHNTPASQVSMLGRITGLAFAPVGACSTFGVALKLAMDAIDRGEADLVVVGATDPPPHPLTVGAFYSARVISADAQVSKPLDGLRGTHVAGGSVIWLVGDLERLRARGFRPLGMEPLGVGVSADADHIITPSVDGPTAAMRQALGLAAAATPAHPATPGDTPSAAIGSWDLHATATPGDYLEMETLRAILPGSVLVTARKGTFGHGMGAGGGWELTAQYLGYERGLLFPTTLTPAELHPEIARLHDLYVFDQPLPAPPGLAGKLSMGIGGINTCVLSRPW
ncbi:MAG TPA: beta-ketoacyl synthase N-terminal-like domain-containing protein [Thermoanaerobaculia bacterium]|nr:beta-ketoacyl synthase N-terminal-like domain-containing protein [Thermoanaerobaculia bacterium]